MLEKHHEESESALTIIALEETKSHRNWLLFVLLPLRQWGVRNSTRLENYMNRHRRCLHKFSG